MAGICIPGGMLRDFASQNSFIYVCAHVHGLHFVAGIGVAAKPLRNEVKQ